MAVNHQTFYQVDKKDKKEQANFLMCFITLVGKKPATSIHGDRRQPEREQALRDFKRGDRPILVATYGMINFLNKDVEVEVKHLLNYD